MNNPNKIIFTIIINSCYMSFGATKENKLTLDAVINAANSIVSNARQKTLDDLQAKIQKQDTILLSHKNKNEQIANILIQHNAWNQLRNQIRELIYEAAKEKIQNPRTREYVHAKLLYCTSDFALNPIWTQIQEQIRNPIGNQAYSKIRRKIQTHITNKIKLEVFPRLNFDYFDLKVHNIDQLIKNLKHMEKYTFIICQYAISKLFLNEELKLYITKIIEKHNLNFDFNVLLQNLNSGIEAAVARKNPILESQLEIFKKAVQTQEP